MVSFISIIDEALTLSHQRATWEPLFYNACCKNFVWTILIKGYYHENIKRRWHNHDLLITDFAARFYLSPKKAVLTHKLTNMVKLAWVRPVPEFQIGILRPNSLHNTALMSIKRSRHAHSKAHTYYYYYYSCPIHALTTFMIQVRISLHNSAFRLIHTI